MEFSMEISCQVNVLHVNITPFYYEFDRTLFNALMGISNGIYKVFLFCFCLLDIVI